MRGFPVLYFEIGESTMVGALVVECPGDAVHVSQSGPRNIPASRCVSHYLEQGPMDDWGVRTTVLLVDDDISRHAVRFVSEVVVTSLSGLGEGHDFDPVGIHYQHQITGVDGTQRAIILVHHRTRLNDDHRRERTGRDPHRSEQQNH